MPAALAGRCNVELLDPLRVQRDHSGEHVAVHRHPDLTRGQEQLPDPDPNLRVTVR